MPVIIDKLSREDKKFAITSCSYGSSCKIVITGEYMKIGSVIGLVATEFEKAGMTKIFSNIENKINGYIEPKEKSEK